MAPTHRPKPSTLIALGDALRQERRRQRLTQATLAARTGLHESYISFLEAGRRNPTFGTLLAITDALGVSLPALIRSVLGDGNLSTSYGKEGSSGDS